jgi:hypothetical protein
MVTKTSIVGANAAPIEKASNKVVHAMYADLRPIICARSTLGLLYNQRQRLTLAIGLQISALMPIAIIRPAVESVTTWLVVFKSSLISVLADNRDVLEKHAASVLQLHAKTIIHFLHNVILS